MPVPVKTLIDRLTGPARLCLESAASRAFSRTHFELDVEHVLQVMLEQDRNAARSALAAQGVREAETLAEIEAALETYRTGNTRNPVLAASIPLWLETAWLSASAEHALPDVSTLDLLLALHAHPSLKGVIESSVPSLSALDVPALHKASSALRDQGGESAGRLAQPGPHTPPVSARARSEALARYTIDLTGLARAGKLDPVLGRDAETRQLIDVLMRRRQNNPILTGEPGVGKTAVVEGLALRIARHEVPPALKDVALHTLDLGLLQAGASVKGEFENRLRQVMEAVRASPHPVILFIDEAHTLIGAGGAAGQNDAANLLKPALARGELRTIAATTWAEYKKYFEKDAALARRFQVIKVEEPGTDTAIQMLRGVADALARHHGVDILDEAIVEAVMLSSRYLSGRQLPDKAVSVLDTACARVALSRAGQPACLEDLQVLVANIDRELAALGREQGHEERIQALQAKRETLAADHAQLHEAWQAQRRQVCEIDSLKQTEPPEPARIHALRSELREAQHTSPLAFECVDGSVIADVISGWTGIPLGRMVSNELGRVRDLSRLLSERVIGQDHALALIAQRVQVSKARLEDPGKPKGVFLLVGPSGVGKTETALGLADALYGGERNLVTLNLSEYQEAHTVSSLKGSPPGYVGYGEGGVLTEAVRRKPYSVVLLDEVEKAHPDVLELFFQVFDKGVLEDAEGREVDFRQTIILLTSNAGSERIVQACEHGVSVEGVRRAPTAEDLAELLRPSLQQTFKPAFLGRLSIVPYFPLSDESLRKIMALKLAKIRRRILENHGATLEYSNEVADHLAACCTDIDSGARDADGILNRTLLAPLASEILERMASGKPLREIRLAVNGEGLQVRVGWQ